MKYFVDVWFNTPDGIRSTAAWVKASGQGEAITLALDGAPEHVRERVVLVRLLQDDEQLRQWIAEARRSGDDSDVSFADGDVRFTDALSDGCQEGAPDGA